MTPLSSPSVTRRTASPATAINVLIAGGFSIAGLISPKSILPAGPAPIDAPSAFPTVTTVTSFADVETGRQPERRRAER